MGSGLWPAGLSAAELFSFAMCFTLFPHHELGHLSPNPRSSTAIQHDSDHFMSVVPTRLCRRSTLIPKAQESSTIHYRRFVVSLRRTNTSPPKICGRKSGFCIG